jgi:hypothetical protein
VYRHELDWILTRMLEAHGPVSDLNFSVGRPPQVEKHGELVPVASDPPLPRLTPFQDLTTPGSAPGAVGAAPAPDGAAGSASAPAAPETPTSYGEHGHPLALEIFRRRAEG